MIKNFKLFLLCCFANRNTPTKDPEPKSVVQSQSKSIAKTLPKSLHTTKDLKYIKNQIFILDRLSNRGTLEANISAKIIHFKIKKKLHILDWSYELKIIIIMLISYKITIDDYDYNSCDFITDFIDEIYDKYGNIDYSKFVSILLLLSSYEEELCRIVDWKFYISNEDYIHYRENQNLYLL